MTQQAESAQKSTWSDADKAAIESATTADEKRSRAEFVMALSMAREKCGTAALDRVFGGQKGGSFSYRYASSEEIIRVAREAMMGCNLVVFPTTVAVVGENAEGRAAIIRKMTVMHVAGWKAEAAIEWPVVVTPGRPRDKALAAAATASLAYLLRDLLLIERAGEVEEDEDEDEAPPTRRTAPGVVAVARSNGPGGRATVQTALGPQAAPAAPPAIGPQAAAASTAAGAAHQGVAVAASIAAGVASAAPPAALGPQAAAALAAASGDPTSVAAAATFAEAASHLVKERIGSELGGRLLAAPTNEALPRPLAVEVINAVATACDITAPAVTVRFKLVQGVVPTAKTLIDAIIFNWPKAKD